MLKTMLCEGPEQDFVDELFLFCPRWLHPDLDSMIRRHVGSLTADGAVDRLLDFLYSGKPYGWFWANVESQLDRALLAERLRNLGFDRDTAGLRQHCGQCTRRPLDRVNALAAHELLKVEVVDGRKGAVGVVAESDPGQVPRKGQGDPPDRFVHRPVQVLRPAGRRFRDQQAVQLRKRKLVVQQPDLEVA